MKYKLLALPTLAALALSACNNSNEDPITGTFLDTQVDGLAYVSNGVRSETTKNGGQFFCYLGVTIQFKVGNIDLGSTVCTDTITPLTLAGGNDASADAVVNRLLFLQILDEDDNPSNGIKIASDVAAALPSSLDFTQNATSFNSALAAALPAIADKLGNAYTLRGADATQLAERRVIAKEHFSGALAEMGNIKDAFGGEIAIVAYPLQADTSFFVPYLGDNTAVRADFPNGFYPAVGSGLAYKGKAIDGSLEFYGITDRGPNGDGPAVELTIDGSLYTISKVFPAPNFAPSLGLISVSASGAVVKSMQPLWVDANTKVTGRPLPTGSTGTTGEAPLNDHLVFDAQQANFDLNGLDPESIVIDSARNLLWASDEYGPFIVKIDPANSQVLKRYQPGAGTADLPSVLAKRRANRGMEGLTLDNATGKLHGFLQSPIDDGKATDTADLDADGKSDDTVNVRDYAQLNRWIEFDPDTETSKLYAYPLNFPIAGQKWDRNRSGSTKLGDVVALGGGQFLVIEQGADENKKVRNFIMLVEIPANATDIATIGSELEKNSIDGTTNSITAWADVVKLKKTVLLDLNAAGWLAEKAEGLTLVDAQTIALINDNDFGLRSVLVDADDGIVSGSIEDCSASAAGVLTCKDAPTVVTGRVTRGVDNERPTRLWLIKFAKALSSYRIGG